MEPQRKKILVVDDNFQIIELINSRLSAAGYQVICAVNGAAALRRAREDKPHIIVMDILLPDMNGSEVIRTLEEEGCLQGSKVLFLSAVLGQTRSISADGMLTIGDRNYECLPKPFRGDALLAKVNFLLKQL